MAAQASCCRVCVCMHLAGLWVAALLAKKGGVGRRGKVGEGRNEEQGERGGEWGTVDKGVELGGRKDLRWGRVTLGVELEGDMNLCCV
eukprot:3482291-Pleurochrysis_carterae.AAC.1